MSAASRAVGLERPLGERVGRGHLELAVLERLMGGLRDGRSVIVGRRGIEDDDPRLARLGLQRVDGVGEDVRLAEAGIRPIHPQEHVRLRAALQ